MNETSQHTQSSAEVARFVEEMIVGAIPADSDVAPNKVRDARRYATDYLDWCLESDATLSVTLFESDAVESYKSHLLDAEMAKGSVDARVSHLKRLHPSVGLDGTTRVRRAPESIAESAPTGPIEPLDHPPQATPELIESMMELRPLRCPVRVWAEIGPVVAAGVSRVPNLGASRARALMRSGALLAGWVRSSGRPLRVELVFHASTVSSFATTFERNANRGSLTTHVSNIRSIQRAIGLEVAPPLVWERPKHGADDREARERIVSDDAAIDDLFKATAKVRSAKRRLHLHALFTLVFGAGYFPRELGWARHGHLVEIDGRVCAQIHTPSRWNLTDSELEELVFADTSSSAPGSHLWIRATVPFLDGWQDRARQILVDSPSGEGFLLGGSGKHRRSRTNEVAAALKVVGASVDLAAARERWMAEVLYDSVAPLFAALHTSTIHLNRLRHIMELTTGECASVDPEDGVDHV